MSLSKTPTKERVDKSGSKKTPVKGSSQKQQSSVQEVTPAKVTPVKSAKKINIIEDIKQQFLAQNLYDSELSSKQLALQLKRILAVEGVDSAANQLKQCLLNRHVIFVQKQADQKTIHQSLSKLSSSNLSGLVYLFEQLIEGKAIQFIQLLDWVNALWRISPDLVSYSNPLKQSIFNFQTDFSQQQLSSVKGKISLITQN